jgi:N-hydroxyarylamine O-acetyltransferase
LLEQLGFSVKKLSARVLKGDQLGPEFDHLVLTIELKERWIADVGFGDSFLEPLPLDSEEEHVELDGAYRLIGSGSKKTLERRREFGWQPQYFFSLTSRQLVEFSTMCQRHQISPDSVFTQNTVCSVATPDGRITLSNGRLITTVGEQFEERKVTAEADYRSLLQDHFGIDLGSGIRSQILFEGGEPR